MRSHHPTMMACLSLLACACAKPATVAAPHYPALTASAERARLSVETGLTQLPLSCRAKELPLPNALDDDCDGRVDGAPQGAALTVAVAAPTALELELVTVDAKGAPIPTTQASAPPACGSTTGAIALFNSYAALPGPGAKVLLRLVNTCGVAAPVQVAVTLNTPEGTRSYVATLAPDKTLLLGHFDAT